MNRRQGEVKQAVYKAMNNRVWLSTINLSAATGLRQKSVRNALFMLGKNIERKPAGADGKSTRKLLYRRGEGSTGTYNPSLCYRAVGNSPNRLALIAKRNPQVAKLLAKFRNSEPNELGSPEFNPEFSGFGRIHPSIMAAKVPGVGRKSVYRVALADGRTFTYKPKENGIDIKRLQAVCGDARVSAISREMILEEV